LLPQKVTIKGDPDDRAPLRGFLCRRCPERGAAKLAPLRRPEWHCRPTPLIDQWWNAPSGYSTLRQTPHLFPLRASPTRRAQRGLERQQPLRNNGSSRCAYFNISRASTGASERFDDAGPADATEASGLCRARGGRCMAAGGSHGPKRTSKKRYSTKGALPHK
jgi:hypothetical protein